MWQITGHERAVSLLRRGIERGAKTHAYLFIGPPHVGKMTLAVNLAQALNCEADEPPCGGCGSCRKIASAKHADVQIIELVPGDDSNGAKLRTEIGIDQVRQMQSAASLPPFEGRCKVFIFDGAEMLSTEAANCLLKTLEEPVGRVVFVLLTSDEGPLPQTVVSRCQRVEMPPLPAAEVEDALSVLHGVEPEKARLLARLSHGCMGWAVSAVSDEGLLQQRAEMLEKLLEVTGGDNEARFAYAAHLAAQFSQSRQAVQGALDSWVDWWRDLLLVKAGCADAITNVDFETEIFDMAGLYSLAEIRTVIESLQAAGEQLRQNASPRLALEVLMLGIPRKEVRGERNLAARVSVKNG